MAAQDKAITLASDGGSSKALEQLVSSGDLTSLSPAERVQYYAGVCNSLGLNPLTRPFDYLKLNGKLILYARKEASDQLRRINGVSITKIEREQMDGLYSVTAYARSADGREDADMGVVSIKGLQGEALANGILKAITKAKRRVTLSICGLGMLDESEIHSISGAQRVNFDPTTGEIQETANTPDQHTQHVQRAKATVVTNATPPANGNKEKAAMPIDVIRERFPEMLRKAGFGDEEIAHHTEMFDGFENETDKREFALEIGKAVKSGELKPKPAFVDPFSEVTPVSEAVQ